MSMKCFNLKNSIDITVMLCIEIQSLLRNRDNKFAYVNYR